MTALAATDVTIVVQSRVIKGLDREHLVKITFGDSALTYPTGGVPMPAFGKFGFFQQLKYLRLIDPNDGVGLVWKYDREGKALRAWQSPAETHVHDILVIGSATGGIDEPMGVEGTDTLAKDAATNRTIAGASSATKGGIVSTTLAAAALVELGAVAVAAQTLYAEAVGY